MKLIKSIPLISLLALCQLACTSLNPPAGFWQEFEKKYQVEYINKQGPWGGRRIIHWKIEEGNFGKSEIIDWASKNGWELQADTFYLSEITKTWKYEGEPIFPIHWSGFRPKITTIYSGYAEFPRWVIGNVNVLQFSSNYISINLETQEEIRTNGFIIFGPDQKEMTLYQSWGE